MITGLQTWFFIPNLIAELAFAAITLIISIIATKIFRITLSARLKTTAIAFLMLSISYAIQGLIILLQYIIALNLHTVFFNGLLYLHFILNMMGFALLLYMSFNVNDVKVLSFVLLIPIVTLILHPNKQVYFYTVNTFMLLYPVAHFLINHLRKKHVRSLLMLMSFVGLMATNIVYAVLFGFVPSNERVYIMGHLIEMTAYVLMIFAIVLKKNGKKKNPN